MKLGTQDKDFFPRNIDEKFEYVKNMGFDCFEIDGRVLIEHQKEVKNAIAVSGLPVSSACGGYRGWIGDFIEERRLNAVTDISDILRLLSDIGGTGIVVPAAWGMFSYRLPPMTSPRSREGDKKALLASLDALDPIAEKYGVWVYLEPLNRYEDHMLNTLAQAQDIIDAGHYRRVKLTYDFYHMNIEEDNMVASLKKYKDSIGHIHIAENHRYQPGTGSIDWPLMMNALKEIHYEGPVINEGRVRGDNQSEAYQKSVMFMRKFM